MVKLGYGKDNMESIYGNYVVSENSPLDAIKNRIQVLEAPGSDEESNAFYHLSIDEVVRRFQMWKETLPRIQPHYAVKCNTDPAVLQTLALMGAGFDCASKSEIKAVLAIGVSPSRIIFANPCKVASHIAYARKQDVKLATFDSASELRKVAKMYPELGLVIRIRCDAASAQCELGIKFGVMPEQARPLLKLAAELKLNVVGVAFHVGSGCSEPQVYQRAIKAAKDVFMEAQEEGHNPTLLDIGGGYMGDKDATLDEVGYYINMGIDEHFPEDSGVTIISEPGRFMVASAFVLATNIVNKREIGSPADANDEQVTGVSDTNDTNGAMYFIDDGVYGSFNCIIYDHQVVTPIPFSEGTYKQIGRQLDSVESSIWGPTCDGFDKVIDSVHLPSSMNVGDWFVWEDMGAYTLAAAGNFNGFPLPKVIVHMTSATYAMLDDRIQKQLALQQEEESASATDSAYSFGTESDECESLSGNVGNTLLAIKKEPSSLISSSSDEEYGGSKRKLNKRKSEKKHFKQLSPAVMDAFCNLEEVTVAFNNELYVNDKQSHF